MLITRRRERRFDLSKIMQGVIVALAAAVPLWAGPVRPVIARTGNQTAIELTEATDLRNVLEHLCARTNTQCEIATETASITVPSMRIAGLLPELVSKLLEGTNLNYIVVDAAAGSPGRLIVTPQKPVSLSLNSTAPLAGAPAHFVNNDDSQLSATDNIVDGIAEPIVSTPNSPSGSSLVIASPVAAGAAAGETSSGAVNPTSAQISEDAIRRMYAPPKYPRGSVVLPTDDVGNPNDAPSHPPTTDPAETH